MAVRSGVVTRIKDRFNGLDLRGKLTAILVSGALIIGGTATVVAYVGIRENRLEHTDDLLQAWASLERREIELRLGAALAQAEAIANNTITANALADSVGRETYLGPLLRNQKTAIAGSDLSIVDYRGKPVASSIEAAIDHQREPVFLRMMQVGKGQAGVATDNADGARLIIALPIHYRLTGEAEGGVLLRVPLAALLADGDVADTRGIADAAQQIIAGVAPSAQAVTLTTGLLLPAPVDALKLSLVLARDRSTALGNLNEMLLAAVLAGFVVIAGLVLLARTVARFVTASLRDTVMAAEEIAAAGRPVARLPLPAKDEFGRLTAAFNTMVGRLLESYADLEARVAERTRELEASQRQAEAAGNLLRESVSSIAQGFTIYDENDRLVHCNEAYLRFYETSRDLIVPGATFEDIIRRGAERGQYVNAIGRVDEWVKSQVAQHQNANGKTVEQQLTDGRWLMIVEYRTPSGYIVGNRVDVTELKQVSEALRAREAYLRATLDNLPFLFWLKDTEGRFLAVNKNLSDAGGRESPDALLGLTDLDVWPRELAEAYRADDREVMASRVEKTVKEPIADGTTTRWIETFKKPVVGSDGQLLGTVGFARDISEPRRMQQALAESEQRWELSVRGANDGIWDWNLATGRVHYSERWKTMLGHAPEEIGSDVAEWNSRIFPEDVERVQMEMKRHLRGESEFYSCEHRLRCKDGSYKWVLSRGQALFDEDGRPIRMAGSQTDITGWREAEARILDRTEQLNAIFALSPDGFVSFDRDHRVKYVSPAFMRMTGFTEEEVVGLAETAFGRLLADACIETARFPEMDVLRAGLMPAIPAIPVTAAVAGNEGREGDARSRRQLIELSGAGKRVLEVGLRLSQAASVSQILYFRDVTHESEVDQMKSEFLSTAAHELRTPMASIYGFSEVMLAYEFSEEEKREFLTAIHSQAELMASIVNELLDLARIEARRGKDFKFERIDIGALLREIVGSFKAPEGRAEPVEPAPAAARWVRADRKKLMQAVGNVLSNAYKYSPNGGRVLIEIVDRELDGGHGASGPCVGIRISDQGIGMTPEQLSRICERFYRADTSGKIPGTGLGMSIVKEIVELHGGEVGFSSHFGAGTAVTLWLPAMAREALSLAVPLGTA